MEKNSQRVIMISGANRGIGKAIREKLQSENYLLSLGLRNPDAFRDSKEKHQTENACSIHRVRGDFSRCR